MARIGNSKVVQYTTQEQRDIVNSISLDNDNLDFIEDEEFFDEPETFRSIHDAVGENGYVDLSRQITPVIPNFEPEPVKPQLFDMSNKEEMMADARQVAESMKKDEFAEKQNEWSKSLAALNTRMDHKAVASFIDMGVIFERVEEVMRLTDEVYAKFSHQPLRYERHKTLLDEIMNDLKEEEKIIDEYRQELARLE